MNHETVIATSPIQVTYRLVDGVVMTRNFLALKGAREFAIKYVREHPEIGTSYAIAGDGVGKITCSGVTLHELFSAS
jgi:hypothetical protein